MSAAPKAPALRFGAACLAATASLSPAPAQAAQFMVSANDGKYVVAADGSYQAADPAVPDTVTVLDVSSMPPRVLGSVVVDTSVVGPPTEVAVSPDASVAVVSGGKRLRAPGRPELDEVRDLVLVGIAPPAPAVLARLAMPSEPYGIGFSPGGDLLGVAHFDGTVSLVGVRRGALLLLQTLRIAPEGARISQVSFTRDGRFALASRRDETKVQVLRVEGGRLVDTGHFLTAGAQAYTMDVGARWAAVANVGWTNGDADSVSLIDLRAEPFRTASTVTVPPQPEGLALSPDGRLLAVGSVNGANLPQGHPRRQLRGVLGLYRIEEGGSLTLLGQAPTGTNTQGVAFTPDGRHVAVQDYMEGRLAFYAVDGERLSDAPFLVTMPGHPAALRAPAPGP